MFCHDSVTLEQHNLTAVSSGKIIDAIRFEVTINVLVHETFSVSERPLPVFEGMPVDFVVVVTAADLPRHLIVVVLSFPPDKTAKPLHPDVLKLSIWRDKVKALEAVKQPQSLNITFAF